MAYASHRIVGPAGRPRLLTTLLDRPEWRLLIALAIGLLIGADRERRKGEQTGRSFGGLRTFAFAGLVGGVTGLLDQPVLTAAAGLFIGGAALAAYVLGDRSDPGLTSEVAFVATFLLGFMAADRPTIAVELGVISAALLAWRTPLHRLVRDGLSEQEMLDGMAFAIAALVVLPLLPNRAIDPFGLINPAVLWRLVVVLTGLSALGYVAARLVGARFGLVVAGFVGGLVSSTATIAAMAARAKAAVGAASPAAAGGVASMVSSLGYLAVLIGVARPALLLAVAQPLALAGLALALWAAALTRRAVDGPETPLTPGRAFDFKAALIFVALVTGFTLIARGLEAWLGEAGVLVGAALTGLVDLHAAAASVAALAAAGDCDDRTGSVAVVLALSTNMLVKAPTAYILGGRAYGWRVSLGIAVLLAGLWTGIWLFGLRA